jgi:hypothetical protein
MSRLLPWMLVASTAACSGAPAPGGDGTTSIPEGTAASQAAPGASADAGAVKRLHLIFTGNVHGEIEPCG